MLKEILQNAIKELSDNNIKVYDICILKIDYKNFDATLKRMVSIWEYNSKKENNILIVDKEHPLRRIAEEDGCEAVQMKWNTVDLIIKEEHPMFKSKEDILNCLRNVKESTEFMLKADGRYYLQEDGLLFEVEKTWVKLRGDFSHNKSMFAEKGTFWVHPSPAEGCFTGRYNTLVWSSSELKIIYNQHLFLRDIKMMDDAEVIAILL